MFPCFMILFWLVLNFFCFFFCFATAFPYSSFCPFSFPGPFSPFFQTYTLYVLLFGYSRPFQVPQLFYFAFLLMPFSLSLSFFVIFSRFCGRFFPLFHIGGRLVRFLPYCVRVAVLSPISMAANVHSIFFSLYSLHRPYPLYCITFLVSSGSFL